MSHNDGGDESQRYRRDYEPRRFKSLVAQLHREAQQRRPQQDDRATHEAPLVMVTRRLVVANIALVIVTILLVGAGILQWRNMQGQLAEMRADTRIRRTELAAVMNLYIHTDPDAQLWQITPEWTNAGKTDANNVRGWDNLHILRFGERMVSFDFLNDNSGKKMATFSRVIAGDHFFMETTHIGMQDAWDYVYGLNFPVTYGYLDYTDEFGTYYVIRYCRQLNFEWLGDRRQMRITLPVKMNEPCETRTKQERASYE